MYMVFAVPCGRKGCDPKWVCYLVAQGIAQFRKGLAQRRGVYEEPLRAQWRHRRTIGQFVGAPSYKTRPKWASSQLGLS